MIAFIRSVLLPLVSHPLSNQTIIQLQSICGVQNDRTIRKDKFIYQIVYLCFKIASAMGEEMFSCIPLLFWFMFPLAITFITQFVIILLCGQLLKDILQLPRPFDKRIIILEQHFETEFGMPSTHTLAGFLPLSILFKCQRHGIIVPAYCFYINLVYIGAISTSRLYMGVHSVMDILGGMLLGSCLIQLLDSYGDAIDSLLYFNLSTGIYITTLVSILFLLLYPRMIPWRASCGTSALIFGTWLGASIGLYVVLFCQPAVGDILYTSSFFQYVVSDRGGVGGDHIYTANSLLNLKNREGLIMETHLPIISASSDPSSFGKIMTSVSCKVTIGVAVLLLVKLSVKSITLCTCKLLYAREILRRYTGEENDAYGRAVPLDKAYCIEIPVRVLTYASISFSVVYITPLIWSHLGLV